MRPSVLGSLAEVLKALEDDHDFLLEGDVLHEGRDRHLDRVQVPVAVRSNPREFYLYHEA